MNHPPEPGPGQEPQPQSRPPEAGGADRRSPWWRHRARLIIVPLDGSAEAKLALAAGRLIAPFTQACLEVIHVTDEPVASAQELLKRAGLEPEETSGLVVEQGTGEPAEAIAEFAKRRNAMLISMTIRGLTRLDQWQVSPVVESVLNLAHCPVLLMRPELAAWLEQREQPRRILVPLDGTPSSAAAVGPALDLADRMQARVDILNVAIMAEPPREPGSLTAPRYIDQPQHEWPIWAQEFASRFGTALGQLRLPKTTRVFVRSGDPPLEIVRFAEEEESDLIVLAWKGGQGPEAGAVINRVLADMPCPVLLLPPAD